MARDEEIGERLERILLATGWFIDPKIRVEEGVVFLRGAAGSAELKKWAGDLARNTRGVNGQEHSWLKVRSSVIRLVKRAFQDQGISMPDEAREVIFPNGIPVTMVADSTTEIKPQSVAPTLSEDEHAPEVVATRAEGGLSSEADTLDEQARRAQTPDQKENLLRGEKSASGAS